MTERELSTRDLAGTSPDDATTAEEFERGEAPNSEMAAGSTDQYGPDADDKTPASGLSGSAQASNEQGPLLPQDQSDRFVTRWHEIQTSFVDEPRESVAQADALVADLMQRLAASFSDAREGLEEQWDRGDDVSTEDLRVALRRYRAFFDRLLSA